jgi:hypothetical protein
VERRFSPFIGSIGKVTAAFQSQYSVTFFIFFYIKIFFIKLFWLGCGTIISKAFGQGQVAQPSLEAVLKHLFAGAFTPIGIEYLL